jgi:hypothetical protein
MKALGRGFRHATSKRVGAYVEIYAPQKLFLPHLISIATHQDNAATSAHHVEKQSNRHNMPISVCNTRGCSKL